MKSIIAGIIAGLLTIVAIVEILEASSLSQRAEQYQRARDLVHIQRVVYAGAIVEIKYRNISQRLDAEEKIDCSHCPEDFQDAWTTYIQEQRDNYQSMQRKGKEVISDELAALALSYLDAENIAGHFAVKGLETALTPAETSQVALNRLKVLLLKYKNAVPD